MGLNMAALSKVQKTMEEEQGGDLFLTGKHIKDDTSIRLLPPLPKMEGMYFATVVKQWINKKPYTSLETFGEACPITEELEAAKEQLATSKKPDKELHTLLSDEQRLKKKKEFYIPVLLLDADGKVLGPRVLQAGPMLMREINKIVTGPRYQNESENGITDRKLGRNLSLSKTGEGIKTEYKAVPWPNSTVMPKEYYTEDKIPDVLDLVEKSRKSEVVLRSAIRNYLYGEDLIEEEDDKDERPAKKSGAGKSKSRGADPVESVRRMQERDEEEDEDTDAKDADDDDEEEKPVKKSKDIAKGKAAAAPKKKADDDDEDGDDEDDDDEEEEAPKGKGKVTVTKKKSDDDEDDDTDEDDDDEDEENDDPPPAKGKAAAAKAHAPSKPSPGPKGGKAKKPADDDDLDDE